MAKAYVKHDYAVTGRDYVETEGGGDTPAGGISYSTEEQDTGLKWLDEKPIYQKTYDIGAIPNSTSKVIDTLAGVDKVIFINGFCYQSNAEAIRMRPLPFIAVSSTNDNIRLDVTDNELRIVTASAWTNYTGFVTIQYTKTE